MNEKYQLDCLDNDTSFRARSYQDQLLEEALKQNVIIYLPTGAGKTFIALMACKRMSKELDGTLAEGGKRSVFLTNTVALAKQQFEVIKKFTNLKVGIYTGDMNVDNWKRERWEIEMDKYQVFVATTQIIVDIIRHKYISIDQFKLMIFDECHHATKGHVMLQLMAQFNDVDQKNLPRVIGLSGVLIKAASKNLIEELRNLEAVFRAKIVTVQNIDEFKNVLLYSTKPQEIIIPYNDLGRKFQLSATLNQLIQDCIKKLKTCRVDETHYKLTKNMSTQRLINPIKKMENLLNDFIYQLEDLGSYGGYIALMSVLVEVELKKRSAETIAYRNFCRIIIGYVERILHLIKNSIFDEDDEDETELDVIYNSSSTKVIALLTYLKREFTGKSTKDIKCLVFVKRRHTAKNLYHIIKKFVQFEKNVPIIPNFMVGVHSFLPESIECILETKKSRHVLDEFQTNECNLIVASSVLEEGIDVQSCNYVIVYDPLLGFSSYVQTKGRARMEKSIYAMLMPQSDQSRLLDNVRKFKQTDEELKQYLISKTIDRLPPTQAEIDKQFDTLIPAFFSDIGAKLEADSAVSLLNRYCMSLPNDNYTISSPEYSKVEIESYTSDNYVVKLVLPLQSTIKVDVISDRMPNIKWAKRSAAFKACKLLYENNELNERFLPITKQKCLEKIKPLYFKEWEKYPLDKSYSAGTKKNRRIYPVRYPKQLCANMLTLGDICYMYTIQIEPEFERDEYNDHIIDALRTRSNFAILMKHKLPKMAPMPLFMSQGQITAYISNHGFEKIIHTQEDYQRLRNFSTMIFKNLVNETWCRYYAQDYRNEDNSFIIVPTIDSESIDWELVNRFQNLTEITETIPLQRRNIILKPEKFLNNIVAKWYTSDNSERFIVTNIRDDLTPLSQFPNSTNDSYASYLEDKWKQTVVQTRSFMLEVKQLTTRINYLNYNMEKKKSKVFDILLVPEMVHNFEFPGHYFLKAKILPSILHRLHYILAAEEIRDSLNVFLNLDANNYNPRPLIVDKTLKRIENIERSVDVFQCSSENKTVRHVEKFKKQIYNWKDFEEPADLARNLQNLYKLDVDYYHFFISQYFDKLTIDHDQFASINTFSMSNRPTSSQNALCDVDSEEKRRIHILEIDENKIKSLEQWELLSAITAAAANDVFDSEKLEVLGDSFLKFSISLYLLHNHPTWNEGFLTEVKGQFVSNRNLLYHAIEMGLPGLLYSKMFKPTSEWKPPSTSVPVNAEKMWDTANITPSVFTELELNDDEILKGVCQEGTLHSFREKFMSYENDPIAESDMLFVVNKTLISDKICADAVEALLGVCVKNVGIKKSFSILQLFGIVPKNDDLSKLLQLNLGSPRLRTDITNREVDAFLLNHRELESNIGYKFNDRAYLLQALTHPSYPTNRITGCYQQLEFIGDAILDFLVTCYIFENCKEMGPGKLTDLRSALVNNVTLACIAVRHRFHLFLLSQNAALSQSIMQFYEFQEQNNFKVTDQVRILTLENEMKSKMADYINVPKTLGDIFEAIIGAIFLDSGNDLFVVWNVLYNLISVELYEFMENVPIQVVRQLYEYHGADPVFDPPVVEEDVIMITCKFTCRNERLEVHGFGKNKSDAKVSAAKAALQHLIIA